jgi:soluble lytic murein transglycosylase
MRKTSKVAIAAADVDGQRFADALATFRSIPPGRLSKIQDHVAFFMATAQFGLQQDAAAIETASSVFSSTPKSPLIARTAILVAKAGIRSDQAARALKILRANYADLTQPAGDQILAETFEKSGDLVSAANYYQRVWLQYPQSREASDAESALERLKSAMGASYPPPMPAAILQRSAKLLQAGQCARVKQDLEAALPSFGSGDQDVARVRLAICGGGGTALRALEISDPEANAERLHHLVTAARKADRESEMMELIREMQQKYPTSKYRLEALQTAGYYYFLKAQPEQYYAVYQQCSISFPRDPQAALCHWRATLAEYLRGRPAASQMLQDHIRYFPNDEHAPAALYYLGRLAESRKDAGSARVYFADLEASYPNFYYTILARNRLKTLTQATPSQEAAAFLTSVTFPSRKRIEDFTPTAATNVRIERSRILIAAALDAHSDIELRFGGRNDGQGHVVAMELAANATRRGSPDQAVRWIKAMVPNYLLMPLESAPREFWRYAYPLPWRKELEEFSNAQGIDPFLMAGLIRQESEFDPRVVSYANAHGLSQIMPPTGRELARRLGIPRYSNALLFNPTINIRMGTFHLKNMFNYFGEQWEETIASYNAGMGRVSGWLKLRTQPFREPSEWVETIPLDQTRGYVQSVLRNADFYRRLYVDAPNEFTAVSYRPPDPPKVVTPAKVRARAGAKKSSATAGAAARRRSAAARKKQ